MSDKKLRNKGFTLIEILIVITIAVILATISLNMNRSRIQQMRNINEKELWGDRHTHINREITNTNFYNGLKITSLQFAYVSGSNKVVISGINQQGEFNEYSGFEFQYHTIISGSILFSKTPLQLGCKIYGQNNHIYLQAKSDNLYCFTLNSALCTRSACEQSRITLYSNTHETIDHTTNILIE